MAGEYNKEFPRAIVHVDGDAFFVACEVACNPALRGKPVVTGAERKIASALSYEAKALGVSRGMPIHEIRRNFPEVIVIPSHYRLYEIFSGRMYRILQRFTPVVEWYSVDECFADITGLDKELGKSYEDIARSIKDTLASELGITFSLGLSSTKVLAKVASKTRKPNGFTVIPQSKIQDFISQVPLGKVWGIGPQTSRYLGQFGMQTALDFVQKSDDWILEHCAKPAAQIRLELSGRQLFSIHSGKRDAHQSLSSTETFFPTSSKPSFLLSELSRHVEDVARSARREGLAATRISFFLKTRDFRYRRAECVLASPTAVPHVLVEAVRAKFPEVFDEDFSYRATGVTLWGLVPLSHVSQDLFSSSFEESAHNRSRELYKIIDSIVDRCGNRILHLCSSHSAFSRRTKRSRQFAIPIIGKVS
jgi:DNA polymerase-4/DNA polymerase V